MNTPIGMQFGVNSKGFSLVSTLVTIGVLSVGASLALQAFAMEGNSSAHIDHNVQADQVLVATASAVQKQDFDDLMNACIADGILNSTQMGDCVSGASLSTSLGTPSDIWDASIVEVRRNWSGAADANGKVCIEKVRCQLIGQGRVLEVSLRAYWESPSHNKIFARMLSVRRTRW